MSIRLVVALMSGLTPIKVMHVVSSLNTGGLERVVINLIKRSEGTRFQPIICCLEEKGDLSQEAEMLGAKVVAMSKRGGRDYRLIPRLISLIRRERVQIVHTHNPLPLFYGGLAARMAGVPIIIHTKHGRNDPEIRRNMIRNHLLSFLTDEIAAVSKDAENVALHIEKIPQRKVTFIVNGIEVEKYQSRGDGAVAHKMRAGTNPSPARIHRMKAAFGIPQDAPVVGNVARLSLAKDHLTLFRALTLVSRRIGNVFLILVGDGELRGELEERAKELGISERTLFLGFRGDVPRLLRVFDLFILSSLTEGTSLTILEAMAARLPVIATAVGGNPGIVKNGVTGILVPPGRPEVLANAIIDLLRDKPKRLRIGIAGYNRVYEHFNVENMVKSYQQIYDYWIARKRL